MIVDQWIKRGEQDLNKNIKYSEIPDVVKGVYTDIKIKITGGCTGDWNVGCRGCENNCEEKARYEWEKMFNFKNIRYFD